jgi:putative ABC transport system permease protein
MNPLLKDFRIAIRSFLKRPGFAAAAVCTLALGIGLNTAIFSVINGVLLKPLPFPASEQLAMVWTDDSRKGEHAGRTSFANFRDWQDRTRCFQELAAFTPSAKTLSGNQELKTVSGARVTTNFFSTMGVGPRLGRGFSPGENEIGRNSVIVLSDGLWRRQFGGDEGIIGKIIQFGDERVTVIGIAPPGFSFPTKAEFWLPLGISPRMKTEFRSNVFLSVIGRLKPEVPITRAQSEMATLAGQLEKEYPKENEGLGASVISLRTQLVGNVERPLHLLWVVLVIVFFICLGNVASLFLARAVERRQDIAIRIALGASQLGISRLTLLESLTLSTIGGIAGLALARVGINWLIAFQPENLPRIESISIDWAVFAFAASTTLFAGAACGIIPAFQALRLSQTDVLKKGNPSITVGGSRSIYELLTVTQTAGTLMALVAAGLLLRSFVGLIQTDIGFNAQNLTVVEVQLPQERFETAAKQIAFERQLEAQFAAMPGVQSVGATSSVLLHELEKSLFVIENQMPGNGGKRSDLPVNVVTENYFRTMNIPILQGRSFTASEGEGTPETAIVNEAFASRYFPKGDAIGKRFRFDQPEFKSPWFTIVGVSGNVRRMGPESPPDIEAFLPFQQNGSSYFEMVIRTDNSHPISSGEVLSQIRTLNKAVTVSGIRTMELTLGAMVAPRQFTTSLVGMFAATALALTALGLYGGTAYFAAHREREIGIRMALGAKSRNVTGMVIRQGMRPVLIGLALGLIVSLAVTHTLRSLLFGVSATDPATFGAITALLTGVALLACWIPALKATRTDPMIALRHE